MLILFLIFFASSAAEGAQPSQPSYKFEVQRDWLIMKDQTRLAVTYYLPVPSKPDEKFPVLLEYLPYRKDDLMYTRDYPLCAYFARHGYVMAKVDIRGGNRVIGRKMALAGILRTGTG